MRATGTPGLRMSLGALALAAVAAVSIAPAAGSTGRGGARTARANAHAARTVYLVERARLKFFSEKGNTLIEHGQAVGTYNAPVVATLTIHSKWVAASVTIYPRGGSISGSANANYKIVKNLGYFGGTFTLGRGTGRYRHISEVNHKPLGISGIINRYNFETEVKANGEATGL